MKLQRDTVNKFSMYIPNAFELYAPRSPNVKMAAKTSDGASMNIIIKPLDGVTEMQKEDWLYLAPYLKKSAEPVQFKLIKEDINYMNSHVVYYLVGTTKIGIDGQLVDFVSVFLYVGTNGQSYQISYNIPFFALDKYDEETLRWSMYSFVDERLF